MPAERKIVGSSDRQVFNMTDSVKTLGMDRLGIDERLALVDEIWASICADAAKFPLSEPQREDLDRRVADDNAFPDHVAPWSEVKAPIRGRIAK